MEGLFKKAANLFSSTVSTASKSIPVTSTSTAEQVEDFKVAVTPLFSTHIPDFNWGAILAVEYEITSTHLSPSMLNKITQHNPLEWIVQQLCTLILLGDDVIRDGLSPATQAFVKNGLAIIDILLHYYYECDKSDKAHESIQQHQLSPNFYKQVCALTVTTGDEKLYTPDIVVKATRIMNFVIVVPRDNNHFVSHIMDTDPKAWFDTWFPKLLFFEGIKRCQKALPDLYHMLLRMITFNDHSNQMQHFIASKDRPGKLRNMLELLMVHITRSATSLVALRMFLNFLMFNPAFRAVVVSSSKFADIIKVLGAQVSQAQMEADSKIEANLLVVKIFYLLTKHKQFVDAAQNEIFDRDGLDAFQIGFTVGGMPKEEVVNSGMHFTLAAWLNHLIINTVTGHSDDSDVDDSIDLAPGKAYFHNIELVLACLRIMRVLQMRDPKKRFQYQLVSVRGFMLDFVYQLSLTLEVATSMVTAEQELDLDALDLNTSKTSRRLDAKKSNGLDTDIYKEIIAIVLNFFYMLLDANVFRPFFPLVHKAILCNETTLTRARDWLTAHEAVLAELADEGGLEMDNAPSSEQWSTIGDGGVAPSGSSSNRVSDPHRMKENVTALLDYIAHFKAIYGRWIAEDKAEHAARLAAAQESMEQNEVEALLRDDSTEGTQLESPVDNSGPSSFSIE